MDAASRDSVRPNANTDGRPPWLFEEARHAGIDYGDPGVAERYDGQHGRLRDFEKEARLIIERLRLGPDERVVDLGCGTGAFALTAATQWRHVDAVDVSAAMLERLREKARCRGASNLETHCAGFLTYEHQGERADAVVCVAALHHLPDFWKALALHRIHALLKRGGRFYLFDVVFGFSADAAARELAAWLSALRENAGDDLANEAVVHIREEHSTFDWIMEGLLQRAGFQIEDRYQDAPQCWAYVCRSTA